MKLRDEDFERLDAEPAEVAHHEAGHAVAAYRLRMPFKPVTIEQKPRIERQVQNRITCALSGAVAQRLFLTEEGKLSPRTIRRHIRQGFGEDDPHNRTTDYYWSVSFFPTGGRGMQKRPVCISASVSVRRIC